MVKAFSVVTALAIPAAAVAQPAEIASEALFALNAVHGYGPSVHAFGRFYDLGAAARRPEMSADAIDTVAAQPAAPRVRTVNTLRSVSAAVSEPWELPIPNDIPLPYQRTFRRLLGSDKSDDFDHLIRAHALRLGLDPRLVKAVIAAESEFTVRAKSPAGAVGLMQVMPATAEYVRVSAKLLFDPHYNIRAGTEYLAYLFARAWRRYHLKGVPYHKAPKWVLQRIIASYNAGPRFLERRRLFSETRGYIKKVLMFYRSKVSELRFA